MYDATITTYWNVETLYYVFNAMASIMAGAGFAGMLKMVFLFAFAIGILAYINGRQLELAAWFFQALIFVSVLNLPFARVTLIDKTNIQPPRVVDNVPVAPAVIAQVVNTATTYMTQAYETAFGVPESLGLAQGDVGFGHRILKQVNRAEIADPGLRADIMQFLKECTMYDIKDNAVLPKDIVGGTDVFNLIFTNSSPARFVTYDTLTPTPTTDTCYMVGLVLKTRVEDAVTAAQTYYGKQAFPLAQSDAIAQTMFLSATGDAYGWIMQASQGTSDALRQSMFNNIWKQAGTSLPAMLNDPAAVSEINALSGQAQAAAQANTSNSIMALMGQETLPHMRNWIEAVIYGIFPLIVVFMVVSSREGAKKVIGGYMMALAWIGLWPILFAIINHLSMMYLKHKLNALGLGTIGGVPFQLTDAFAATIVDEQASIGFMVTLVPFIAGAIIRMGQGGIMDMADRMTTGFSSAAAGAGAAIGAGNYSMGQVGMDTRNINSTSMHKMDYNMGLEGGGFAMGVAGGATARMSADGSASFDQLHNRFAASLVAGSRLESQRSQDAGSTDIAGHGRQDVMRDADSATFSSVKGFERTRGGQQSSGVDTRTSMQGSVYGSKEGGQELTTTHRGVSTFHASTGAQDRFSAGIHAGPTHAGGAPVGSGAGGAAPDPRAMKRIEESMRAGGATDDQIKAAQAQYAGSAQAGGTGQPGGASQPSNIVRPALGAESAKTYEAHHARDKTVDQAHLATERANLGERFEQTGERALRAGQGTQAAQTNKDGREAIRSNVAELSTSRDAVQRHENTLTDRASRSEARTLSNEHNFLNDAEFMKQVAQRNGMSAMRFYSQETPTILRMANEYAAEKGYVAAASNLNSQTLSGSSLPTTSAGLSGVASDARSGLGTSKQIDDKARQDVRRTGYSGADPLKVQTGLPAVGSQAFSSVPGALNPSNPTSIPARAESFNANVEAWASPKGALGTGNANPMGVVEDMEKADIADTGKQLFGAVTGTGKKFTENQKRDDIVGF